MKMKVKKTNIKERMSRTIKEIGNGSKVRGITLIALVVTIIVLLILAGVTIGMATSNDGIIKRASNAALMKYNQDK